MPVQIPLTINWNDSNTLNNFFPIGNEALLVILKKISQGRGEKLVYLWGSSSTGRTHLLQGCCAAVRELGLSAFYISLANLDSLKPKLFTKLELQYLITIDDLHGIAQKTKWEETLFDCFNRIQEAGKRLILAGDAPPDQLGLKLRDLVSRLSSSLVFHVKELSDEDKIKALIFRAEKQGYTLSEEVAQFIFRRCSRDMKTLFNVLNSLDQAAIREKHRLTIPFVKSILGWN